MAPPEAPAPASPGRVIAGKFRVGERIGQGGMGSVYAGEHLVLGVPVAIKLMHDARAESEELRARFHREARAVAQLRSPYVVQLLDYGVDEGVPYMVMERLEGEDLGRRLRREKRLDLKTASEILGQACKALRRAQEAGIVHRDLKPSNLFLARVGDEEVVKIVDFGIAKLQGPRPDASVPPTAPGALLGSPSFMSPEQLRGQREKVDHRSDLWSLGVILFRAVTGQLPFAGESVADLVIQICVEPLPVATRIAPYLPAAADRFFERALARKPEERFQTATEMAAAFAALAAGAAEPGARPPADAPIAIVRRPLERAPARDNTLRNLGVAALLLALLAGGLLGVERLEQAVEEMFDSVGPRKGRR